MTKKPSSFVFSRRQFVRAAAALAALGSGIRGSSAAGEGGSANRGFFDVARRHGRWWFITPADEPMFSIGLNHIDPATLRYEQKVHIWRDKYGGSIQRWLTEAVRPDLQAWGFNTVGWVQEVVTRGDTNHRHSRSFTHQEYQWLDMPYCHMLPFADFHQWEAETRHPEIFSRDFEAWCDYVARAECASRADDPKLIGYFYLDCPTWVHTRPMNEWKGPVFDPEKLSTEAGRRELFDLATRYYQVTHDAIRRYDKNHLILGDRYEGRAALPDEVLLAAKPYVDVMSFQHFSDPEEVREEFEHCHELTGKPVLLADASRGRRWQNGTSVHDPVWYDQMHQTLRKIPGCVGFHLCGAYLRNRCRRRGLRDELERPDTEAIEAITATNRATTKWMRRVRQ